jgi:hypothetical protein
MGIGLIFHKPFCKCRFFCKNGVDIREAKLALPGYVTVFILGRWTDNLSTEGIF